MQLLKSPLDVNYISLIDKFSIIFYLIYIFKININIYSNIIFSINYKLIINFFILFLQK